MNPHIVILLQLIHLVIGQFKIIPPDNPVIGVIGKGVILPCQLQAKTISERLSIQWIFTTNSENIDVSIYDGKNTQNPVTEDKRYQGRTNFFHTEFNKGNVSLYLKNVMVSDKGKYTCSVFFENWYDEVVVELSVAAAGDKSSVFLDGHVGQGIGLTCKSHGWFPEPKVVWLDSKGEIRKEKVITQNERTSSGVFDIISSMNLEPKSDMEVSCRVVNDLLNTACESRVLISDAFFPSTSPWMTAFLVLLFLNAVVIGALAYKLKSNFKRTQDANRYRIDLDFWEAQSHAVPITVDAAGGDLELQVPPAPGTRSSDPSGAADARAPSAVPIALARDGFAAGKRYWEVEVARRPDWVLGVVRGGRERGAVLPAGDSWALHSSRGALFCGRGDAAVEPPPPSCSVVGVLLDLEERRVKFYEAVHMVLLATIPVGEGDAHTFYPFVPKSEGSLAPLVFRPVRIPSALENL
ncbi:butyrophilin subfamily 3 member A2-like [Nothoprocta perdicaria]|uniref:butyrophilin subfamily 3 member A2-like n=1 Tax=Nothoprocta perdicaria TaxID=30464 RepID=UPI000E1B98A3|nr:butyrophilin subfamily 3 member A2-like [Nothoprocta perdicaria]